MTDPDICIYCGEKCEFYCRNCGEAHLVTKGEFDEYHGDGLADGETPIAIEKPQGVAA